jgi:RHS repeat-associated protein
VAKVTSLSDTSELAQAGIMVRAESSSTSAFGAIVDTPSDGIRFYWRNSDGGTSDHRTITGSTAEWVKLTYVNGVVDAYYSSDGSNWIELFEPEAFSSIPTSVSAGLMVSAHSSSLATGTFTNVALTPTTLPSGWSDTDIGSPGIPGGASFDGTTWTVAGSGGANDIGGGGSDQFNFASQSISGNATFIAKVTSLSDTSSIAKAGVMFRADNTASANFAAVIETPDGPQLRWRNSDGTPHHTDASTTTMPMWVKVVYSSGVATGYYSTNGTAWTQVGSSESVSLPSTYLAGLAVGAHNDALIAMGTFTTVQISTGSVPTAAVSGDSSATQNVPYTLDLSTSGGDASNTWFVNWGDGESSIVNGTDSQLAAVDHVYAYTGDYTISASATDSDGTYPASTMSVAVGSDRSSYVENYYDAADRLTGTANLGIDEGASLTSQPDSSLPSRSTSPDLITSYTYSPAGYVSDVTDPRGIQTETTYDMLGRVMRTDAGVTSGSGEPTSIDQVTEYTYDGDNNVLTITTNPDGDPGDSSISADNQVTTYNYGVTTIGGSAIDSNDLLASVEYPAGSTSNNTADYLYNALGQRIQMTDEDGNVHNYTYDVLGRLTLDSVGTLGSGVNNTILALGYSYNALGLPYLDTSYGDAAATTVKNQVEYLYNGFGQLTDEYQSHSGAVNTSTTPDVHYDYGTVSGASDPSLLQGIVYPGGRQIDYVYGNNPIDAAIGRIDGIADNADSSYDLVDYQYLGPSTIVEANSSQPGIQQLSSLDPFGRVADQDYVQASTGQSTTQFQYGYDLDGNVLYSADLANVLSTDGNASTRGQLYSYDALNRLVTYEAGALASGDTSISGTPSANETWTLDNIGNMDSVTSDSTSTSRTINSRNQITGVGSSSLSYDGNGNTLTDSAGNTYTYDAWNRMATATVGGVTYGYQYDAIGQRIQEDNTSSTTTDLYYDNRGQVVEEHLTNSSGTQVTTNVWGQQYVNELASSDVTPAGSSSTTRYYMQHDANFDTTAVIAGNGSSVGGVEQRFIYNPYGAVTVVSPSYDTLTGSAAIPLTPYLFQGGRHDIPTGLMHFGTRDLNTTTQTWAEEDPDLYIQGSDLYQYEVSNPVGGHDPFGTASNSNNNAAQQAANNLALTQAADALLNAPTHSGPGATRILCKNGQVQGIGILLTAQDTAYLPLGNEDLIIPPDTYIGIVSGNGVVAIATNNPVSIQGLAFGGSISQVVYSATGSFVSSNATGNLTTPNGAAANAINQLLTAHSGIAESIKSLFDLLNSSSCNPCKGIKN